MDRFFCFVLFRFVSVFGYFFLSIFMNCNEFFASFRSNHHTKWIKSFFFWFNNYYDRGVYMFWWLYGFFLKPHSKKSEENNTTILGRIYVAEMIIIIYDDDNDDSGMVIMDEKQHNGSFDKIKSFPIYVFYRELLLVVNSNDNMIPVFFSPWKLLFWKRKLLFILNYVNYNNWYLVKMSHKKGVIFFYFLDWSCHSLILFPVFFVNFLLIMV